eukprot:scaffold74939_cov30-Phaeocystis_antarctica.AAC.2
MTRSSTSRTSRAPQRDHALHLRVTRSMRLSRATQVQAAHLVRLAVPVPPRTLLALALTRWRQHVIDCRDRRARRAERSRRHCVDRARSVPLAGRDYHRRHRELQNAWHVLFDPSRLHRQVAVGLRCRRLLGLLKPSDPRDYLRRPRDGLAYLVRASGRHAAKLACPTCDCSAHQLLVDPLDARVGRLHPRDERERELACRRSLPAHLGNLPAFFLQ